MVKGKKGVEQGKKNEHGKKIEHGKKDWSGTAKYPWSIGRIVLCDTRDGGEWVRSSL